MERKLGVTKAREKFGEIIDHVQYQGDTFIINRHGRAAAAVVPVEVYENWKQQRRMFFDAIRKMQDDNKDIDPEEVWEDVLKAQQAVRSSS
ncbi:MAG TPA: type II toxin-antitoxin system prevent-host-death family antitoxin [Anaerolineales bacterium]|jgi:prevent-host-death family protein